MKKWFMNLTTEQQKKAYVFSIVISVLLFYAIALSTIFALPWGAALAAVIIERKIIKQAQKDAAADQQADRSDPCESSEEGAANEVADDAVPSPVFTVAGKTAGEEVKKENDFTIEQTENTFYIYKNGKDYFDGDCIATCGEFILAEGFRGNEEAVALLTLNKLIAIKKNDDGIEASVVLPSGVALIFTYDDKIIILSEAGASVKTFAYGSAIDEERIITDAICAYIDDAGEYVLLKCFSFATLSVWSKRIKYNIDYSETLYENDPTLRVIDEALEVVAPDGSVSRFSFEGDVLQK